MKPTLKYISISHQRATSAQRECFFMDYEKRSYIYRDIKKNFSDCKGLLLLSTCNRTEVYFESTGTTASHIRDYLISTTGNSDAYPVQKDRFEYSNKTDESLEHLLMVGNGLKSAVIADAQIIGQLKEAYRFALKQGSQGNLLERAMQALFRCHKKVWNESAWHKGSHSTAYVALKEVSKHLNKTTEKPTSVLIIGAGKIGQEITAYAGKFKFDEVCISNRSAEKARKLADKYGFRTYSWDKVETNQWGNFDAIVTAVGNRPDLIKTCNTTVKIIVDLAMPGNVNSFSDLYNYRPKILDLDRISKQIEQNTEERNLALFDVKSIIRKELDSFKNWYNNWESRRLQLQPVKSGTTF